MSNYAITTNHDGAWRLRGLSDRAADLAAAEAGEYAFPRQRENLEQDIRHTLTALVDAAFAAQYLAEPLPRPPIEVRVVLPGHVDNIECHYSIVKETRRGAWQCR